jgi:ATP-dependent helicase HrpB
LPIEPRLAAMLLTASEHDRVCAYLLCAYLADDVQPPPEHQVVDLGDRITGCLADQRFIRSLELLVRSAPPPPLVAAELANVDARSVALRSGALGRLLLRAFPERLAVREDRTTTIPRYRFASGLELPLRSADGSKIVGASFLIGVDVDADRATGVIRVGAPLSRQDIDAWVTVLREHSPEAVAIEPIVDVSWLDDALTAEQRDVLRCGANRLTLRTGPAQLDAAAVGTALRDRLRNGIEPLRRSAAWNDSVGELVARITLGSIVEPASFTESPSTLVADAAIAWVELNVHSQGLRDRWAIGKIPLEQAITTHLDALGVRRVLDRLLPTQLALPNGSRRPIRYATDSDRPTTRVRLQDMFGMQRTPTVADGRVPIVLELLSPADRPLAITDDLVRFWEVGYPGVRSEVRGRYPKHQWPDDPANAEARRVNHPRKR